MASKEELINGALAQCLASVGLITEAEQPSGRKRHDVRVYLDDATVIIEAEIDSETGAIQDADKRLRQNAAVLVYAVSYEPGQDYRALTKDSRLGWTLRTRDVSSGKAIEGPAAVAQWSYGSIHEFAGHIRRAPEKIANVDMAAGQLLVALDEAARDVKDIETRKVLAERLDLPSPRGGKKEHRDDDYMKRTKRAMLVLASSMLFQSHLKIPGLRNLEECAAATDQVSAFREAWNAILDVDYQPIYETAQTALSALAGCANVNIILQRLAEDVGRVRRNARGHHDLLGRIFHRVLDTARYDGSFYTSSAAATLLASLALPNDREWDHDAVADLRICDPACGTGTLLMAAAERLNHLVKGDTEQDDELDAMLAQLLVEDVLYGYDTNLTATHMSAVALGMLRPETKFEQMHVNRTKFGMLPDREGNLVPRLGSLEWLDTGDDGEREQRMMLEPWPSPVATNIVTGEDEEAPPYGPRDHESAVHAG